MTRIPVVTFIWMLGLLTGPARANDINDFIQIKMAEKHIPGLQLAVVNKGELVLSNSYGLANLQDQIAVQNDTLFNIASITKVFTGVLVLQLAEQGKIDLSASIATYLPDLPKAWHKISVRHLVTHSSGLPDVLTDRLLPIDPSRGTCLLAKG